MKMNTTKNFISLAVIIIVCICFCYKTPALAVTKGSNQKKQVKPSKSYARSARLSSALRNKAVYKQLQQNVDLSRMEQISSQARKALAALEGPSRSMERVVQQAKKELAELAALVKPDKEIQIDDLDALVTRMGHQNVSAGDLMNVKPEDIAYRMRNHKWENQRTVYQRPDLFYFR